MAADPLIADDAGRHVLLASWQLHRGAIVAQVCRETGFTALVCEVILAQLFDHLGSANGDVEPVRRAVRELHRAERERAGEESGGTAALHLALTRALRPALETQHA